MGLAMDMAMLPAMASIASVNAISPTQTVRVRPIVIPLIPMRRRGPRPDGPAHQ